ncbi:MAG: anaerobic glycerol-3-phosphate dehydrogenase subunit C [Candidatus Binataceae bacterium]|nr:anaerobic glycerol-3-phosphate dehydrogenase subunit C [Candidatus Binataceae bacterium]
MKRIEAKPTDGLSYSQAEPKYFDKAGLAKEIDRVYDICLGCRLCFNLCRSFPEMFDAADAKDQDVRNMTPAEKDRVVQLCYDCKLCYLRCPYTPRDQHEFQLDFPRLMTRAKAVKAREDGIGLREKMLGNPDLLGKLGSKTPALANWGCRQRVQRVLMDKLLGIAREKKLPEFVSETFEKWLARNPLPAAPAEPAAKVLLFYTCFGNYYGPEPAKAAIKVMARNQCAVACPKQNCCGMPAIDGGDVAFAQKQARANLESMLPLVRQGYRIIAINPTCSLTMRQEYPELLGTPEAKEFAAAVADTHEVLYELRRAGRMNREFKSTPKSVAYHLPCHLKAQNIGMRSRDLIRSIPGTTVTTVDACTAHDGTWAMKSEFFELSMKLGEKAFTGMREAGAEILASDCQLSAIQIEQATGLRVLHPIEVLARAYEADGFPDAVPASDPAAEIVESK